MTFFTVIVRGLTRRPVRTGLTLLGIAIGIAAVVALVGISRGFNQSWAAGMKARGTDVVVSNMAGSLIPKPFSPLVGDRIAPPPPRAPTCPLFVDVTSIENAARMVVSARERGGVGLDEPKLISGQRAREP